MVIVGLIVVKFGVELDTKQEFMLRGVDNLHITLVANPIGYQTFSQILHILVVERVNHNVSFANQTMEITAL